MVQRVQQNKVFIGFSSEGNTPDKTKIFDLALVKRDLLNHLYTRRGERVMNPKYGCIIWEMLYEDLSDGNIGKIVDDVGRVIREETRVEMLDIRIDPLEHGVKIAIDLLFRPYDIVDTLIAQFDRRSLESRGG